MWFFFQQNTVEMLLNGKSLTDRGTLMQLKSYFNHRTASKDVFNTFNHVEDLLRFITEAYIVYLAIEILEMDSIDGVPKSTQPGSQKNDSKEDKSAFIHQTADQVLDVLWLLPSAEEICNMLEADTDKDVLCNCSYGSVSFLVVYGQLIINCGGPKYS